MFNKPGEIFDRKYEVIEQLGRGGFGTVLKVKEIESGEVYALKYCVGLDPEDAKRFERELDFVEEIYLDNVIRIVDAQINHSPPYYVMPVAEGSLRDLAPRYRGHEGRLLAIYLAVCNGVSNLHGKNCVHRDIKPDNILIMGDVPYVADFGIAKFRSETTAITQAAIGSFEYAAPEQFDAQSARGADERSDIFSLGKLLYWLFTNRSPSHMDLDRLPSVIRPAVKRATEIDPDKRFQSMESLRDVIRCYSDSLEASPARVIALGSSDLTSAEAANTVISAIQSLRPDAGPLVRDFMSLFVRDLDLMAPTFSNGIEPDEVLVAALDDTLPLVQLFARVADSIARMDAAPVAIALFKGIRPIFERYNPNHKRTGSYYEYEFDFAKFTGHELVTSVASQLIRHDRWETLAEFLGEGVIVSNDRRGDSGFVDYRYASQGLRLLDHRNTRLKMNRLSLHADILRKRHTEGELGQLVPMADFTAADYLLHLRSVFVKEDADLRQTWIPWSIIYISQESLEFIYRATSKNFADRLRVAVGVQSIDRLRELYDERGTLYRKYFTQGFWDPSVPRINANEIGTR